MSQEIKTFCIQNGLNIEPILDGVFREVKTKEFKGWYIGSEKTTTKGKRYITFTAGDWRTGEKFTFQDDVDLIDTKERKEIERLKTLEQKKYLAECLKVESEVALRASKEFDSLKPILDAHPYLERKQIPELFGAKLKKNSFGLIELIIPMKDTEGKVWGYQTIEADGQKGFLHQQKLEGVFFQFGKLDHELIFVVEGYSTGASVHLATQKPVCVAFSANNLKPLGQKLRQVFPKAKIVFCADDDQFKPQNFGRLKAIDAASGCRGQVIFPKFQDLTTEPTDFNDLHCLEGVDVVREQILSHKFVHPDKIIETEHTGFHKVTFRKGATPIYEPDPDGLCAYFGREYIYKSLQQSKLCYSFNGKFYTELSDGFLEAFAEKHYVPKPDNKTVSEFVGKVYRTNSVSEGWFQESSRNKINFSNGILDTETMNLLPHSQEIGFKHVLPYDFNPLSKAPMFEKFLGDIMCHDKELIQCLLEFAGYCLSGDECWLQKALVLEGGGQNGKSTFLNVLRDVLGETNCSPLTLSQLNRETSRVMLDGKLANFAEETPNRKMMDSSTFKNLVSGGEIEVRSLYKQGYILKNKAKLIFACNDLPDAADTSHGYFRRLIIIPFDAVFSKENKNLDPFIGAKLRQELPGIFNLCFAAYKKTKDRGFLLEAKKSGEVLSLYKDYVDPVLEWSKESLRIYPLENGHDDILTPARKIYDEFSIWSEQNGHRQIPSAYFFRKIRKMLPDYESRMSVTKTKERKSIKALRAVQLLMD